MFEAFHAERLNLYELEGVTVTSCPSECGESSLPADRAADSGFRSGSLHASAGVQVNHLQTIHVHLKHGVKARGRLLFHVCITCGHISNTSCTQTQGVTVSKPDTKAAVGQNYFLLIFSFLI